MTTCDFLWPVLARMFPLVLDLLSLKNRTIMLSALTFPLLHVDKALGNGSSTNHAKDPLFIRTNETGEKLPERKLYKQLRY